MELTKTSSSFANQSIEVIIEIKKLKRGFKREI